MTTDAYQAQAVLRTAKNILPDILTIVGGHHPTLSPDEFDLDYVDVIAQGEELASPFLGLFFAGGGVHGFEMGLDVFYRERARHESIGQTASPF